MLNCILDVVSVHRDRMVSLKFGNIIEEDPRHFDMYTQSLLYYAIHCTHHYSSLSHGDHPQRSSSLFSCFGMCGCSSQSSRLLHWLPLHPLAVSQSGHVHVHVPHMTLCHMPLPMHGLC